MNKSDFIDKTIEWMKSIVFQEYPGAPKERITVFIEEMTKSHYAVGGVRASDQ